MDLLKWRKENHQQWHRPQHRSGEGDDCYHITAACYEHAPFIGDSPERMQDFASALIETFMNAVAKIHAWCVLPNHYHVLAQTRGLHEMCDALGRLHGRMSFRWNGQDNARGRKTWCGVVDRFIRSERHFWATLNYIHHKPVRHGYVEGWTDWPYSSAKNYLEVVGRDEAARVWREFPGGDYGEGWDDAKL